MTLNEYQKLAARTINQNLTPMETHYHALHGMVSEVGEIHALYQKEYQGQEFLGWHAQKEIGDLLWFIAEYCTYWGWTLEEIAKLNIEKLKKRYPGEGFEVERSLHRAKDDL